MKYLRIFLLVSLLATIVASCDTNQTEFTPDYYKQEYSVTYHVVETTDQVRQRFHELTNPDSEIQDNPSAEMYGFSYNKGEKCHIVMVELSKLSIRDATDLVGHENLHCMFGSWHKNSLKYPKINYGAIVNEV